MKKLIGYLMAIIGGYLWESKDWTGDERYEDLRLTQKLGYNMFCTGIKMMGVTIDEDGVIINGVTL